MNSLEMIDQREQLRAKLNAMLDVAEKEQRKLTEDETKEFEALNTEIRDLENQINRINKETKEVRKMGKFSLLKAINDIANNRQLDERALEVVNQGITEMRKAGQNYSGQIQLPLEERAVVQATVDGQGAETVAEDLLNILEPLRAKLVLAQAGASYMTGLVGNISIPAYSGSQVTWEGEIAEAKDGAGTFTEVKLEPHRLTAYIDLSKQFLIQDSVSAEEMLKRDIVNAIANKLEATILGDGSELGADANAPEGLLKGVTADSEAIDYEGIVAMETELEEANVRGDIKFVVSPSAKAALKTTKLDAGSGKFVMEGNEVNGYPVISTSAVAGKGVIYGNFNDLVIGQWGGIDLTVDPYTQAAKGMVRLVINAYFDAKARRPEAFVKKILA